MFASVKGQIGLSLDPPDPGPHHQPAPAQCVRPAAPRSEEAGVDVEADRRAIAPHARGAARRRRTRTGLLAVGALAVSMLGAPPAAGQPAPRGPWVPSWHVAYGGFLQTDDLAAVGPGEAWGLDLTTIDDQATRFQTAFVHLENGVWRAAQVADDVRLSALAMASAQLGFAVGARGVIFRFHGGTWRPEPSPTTRDLVDVAFASPAEAWAVGNVGTILRWDGGRWSVAASPVAAVNLTAVAAPAPGQAWATTLAGDLLQLEDGTWRLAQAPHLERPTDVAFARPDRGLAVGRGVIELRDGLWRQVGDPTVSYRAVAWAGETAYLVRADRLVRYAGGAFNEVPFAPSPFDLAAVRFDRVRSGPGGAWGLAANGSTVWIASGLATYVRPAFQADPETRLAAIDMTTPERGWAGGHSLTAGFVGAEAGVWTESFALPPGSAVQDIDLTSDADGWAVGLVPGNPPEARMWRRLGGGWVEWPIEKTWRVRDLDMLGADDGWASGDNVVVRWDGAAWSQVPGVPSGAWADALSMLRGGADPEGWFGALGAVYHLSGGAWERQELPGPGRVWALEMAAADEGWAATEAALYRYDGARWADARLPKSARSRVLDVDARGPGNAWVLVEPDGLFHWTGAGWEHHSLTPMGANSRPVRLRVVAPDPAGAATDVWIVGAPPTIARYRVVEPVARLYLSRTLR